MLSLKEKQERVAKGQTALDQMRSTISKFTYNDPDGEDFLMLASTVEHASRDFEWLKKLPDNALAAIFSYAKYGIATASMEFLEREIEDGT